jgi:hypothetical protein
LDINYLAVIRSVTDAEPALNDSVRQPHQDLVKLLKTAACRRCAAFAGEGPERPEIYRGACLLLTLAVLQSSNPYFRLEGLCLLGLRGVDVHGDDLQDRRRGAAAARRKPLRDRSWYVKRHLPRTQARLAEELRALVEHPELLAEAIARNGKTALMRHL